MRMFFPTALILGALAAPALAEGPSVTGGLSLGLTTEDDPGARQSASAYVEAELSGFYSGLSYDAYKDPVLNELDLYLGYRATLGQVDLDTSYTRYNYPKDGGDCCGAVNLNLGVPLGPVSAALDLNYYPEDKSSDAGVSLDYSLPATEALSLSTSYQVNRDTLGDTSTEWSLGATYQLGTASSLSATVYDGTDYDPYVGLDLSWDFTLLAP